MKTVFVLFLSLIPHFLIGQEKTDTLFYKTVDQIIHTLYDVISGDAGVKRNWTLFKSLFKPEAKLISTSKDKEGNIRYLAMSPDEYIEKSGAYLEKVGFFEEEIGRKADFFGLVTHVFSTYQSRNTAQGAVFMRGINSIQLVFDGNRYWIVSILWNNETPQNPIPAMYIEKQKH